MYEKKRNINCNRMKRPLGLILMLNHHLREAVKALQDEQTGIEEDIRSLKRDFSHLVCTNEQPISDDLTQWDSHHVDSEMLLNTCMNIFGVRVPTLKNNHDRSDI